MLKENGKSTLLSDFPVSHEKAMIAIFSLYELDEKGFWLSLDCNSILCATPMHIYLPSNRQFFYSQCVKLELYAMQLETNKIINIIRSKILPAAFGFKWTETKLERYALHYFECSKRPDRTLLIFKIKFSGKHLKYYIHISPQSGTYVRFEPSRAPFWTNNHKL